MANLRTLLGLFGIILLIAALSSFTFVTADESAKSKDHSTEKDASISDDSSQDDSKEKRSQEEILFGNQQNKPSGLVDDLMGTPDSEEENEPSKDDDVKSGNLSQDQQSEMYTKEDNDKTKNHQGEKNSDMIMGSEADNSFNAVPMSSSALQYLWNSPTLRTQQDANYPNSLYDQEDLYRRKRQLLGHPLPLRKRRSLRSSLGQMIQKRGIRMPRRSMRLKRQVDMGDLLTLLGSEGYNQQPQVPGHYSSYPVESAVSEFPYSLTFRHRDGGILTPANDFDDNKEDTMEDNSDDIDRLMLFPPNFRYVDTQSNAYSRNNDDENEAFQKWLERYTIPNMIPVARRSSPTFYPLDYRFIPGYKKRSIFSNGNRMSNAYPGENEDADSDLGQWGHVVQMPEAYASAEDVARLYGLASMMAGGENEEKTRRSV